MFEWSGRSGQVPNTTSETLAWEEVASRLTEAQDEDKVGTEFRPLPTPGGASSASLVAHSGLSTRRMSAAFTSAHLSRARRRLSPCTNAATIGLRWRLCKEVPAELEDGGQA